MEPGELQAKLKAGIAAIRQGDRAHGRTLLLEVVEADERNEPAWLWLSAAVDDPADQLVALENVLALNPQHTQAQAGAQALRAKLGLAEAPPTAASAAPPTPLHDQAADFLAPTPPAPPAPLPPIALIAANPEDDPYQCAYCGRATDPDTTRCPHCRRGLLGSGQWRAGGHLYTVLIIVGLQTQSAVMQAAGVYGYENFPRFASLLPGGDIWAANLVVPAVARAALWALIVLFLLGDSRYSFQAALAVSAADLAWTATGYLMGEVGQLLAAVNAALSAGIGLLAFAAVLSELQSRVRLRVVPDKNLTAADDFHRHAAAYARQGKWALAALHWRRAIALRPRDPDFYKLLGHANARLGRTEGALQAWSSGAAIAPHDPDFQRLITRLRR